VWGLPSPEITVSCTAIPAGADTVGGDSPPPERIVNVAGIRAPLGGGGEVLAEPGAGFGWVVVVAAAAVVVVLVAAVVVVLAAVLVVAPVFAVAPVLAVLVDAGVCAVVVARTLVLVLEEPPHPASRIAGISPRTLARRLTFPA
jgi:hypothetical protein